MMGKCGLEPVFKRLPLTWSTVLNELCGKGLWEIFTYITNPVVLQQFSFQYPTIQF